MEKSPSHTTPSSSSSLSLVTWPIQLAWLNWVVALVFSVSSVLLLQFDWRKPLIPGSQSLFVRLYQEPRVLLYFFICLASVSWLVGFFMLGIAHMEVKAGPQLVQAAVTADAAVSVVARANATLASPKSRHTSSTSKMARTAIETPPKMQVAILGGTGLVGRALAIRLADHPSFRLGFLVGSPDTAGKPLKQVWERKEATLRKQYGEFWVPMAMPESLYDTLVASFDDIFATASPDNVVVISCVAPALGWMEDKLIEKKFDVFSISPHARTRAGVPLVVPEVNGFQLLREVKEQQKHTGRLVKSPNCVSCGLCIVLDALRKAYGGLDEISVTTFQSLSGRGDALYDRTFVIGNVLPLGRTEEDTNRKIRDEVIRVLDEPDLRISVTAQRVYTQRGHFVDLRVKTRNPVPSESHVALALERYAPFANTPFADLPDSPNRGPIRVSTEPMWPRPVQAVELGMKEDQGMTVHVGQICTDDRVFDITLSFVVDNIARGAYGAALLTAEVFDRIGDRKSDIDGTLPKASVMYASMSNGQSC